jgi:hypothetical protein
MPRKLAYQFLLMVGRVNKDSFEIQHLFWKTLYPFFQVGMVKDLDEMASIHLLLLGAAQSGKSTFFRQLQILHGSSLTTMDERIAFRAIVNENLLISLHTLVSRLPTYQICLTGPGSEKVL